MTFVTEICRTDPNFIAVSLMLDILRVWNRDGAVYGTRPQQTVGNIDKATDCVLCEVRAEAEERSEHEARI
jgi:hypothetical protein